MNTLEDLELQIMELEERLRPIAQRPVDVAHPGWAGPLRAGAPPLDEAGVRSTAERLLGELIAAYGHGPEETRAAIRRLFTEYRARNLRATETVSSGEASSTTMISRPSAGYVCPTTLSKVSLIKELAL